MSKYLYGMHVGLANISPMPDHMATAAQWHHVKLMFWLIGFVMIFFCLCTAIDAGARCGIWQVSFCHGIMNCVSSLFLDRISILPYLNRTAICYSPFFGLMMALSSREVFLRIVVFALRLSDRCLTVFSSVVRVQHSLSARPALAPQPIASLFARSIFRKRLPRLARRAFFSFSSGLGCVHYAILLKLKAPWRAAFVVSKRAPGGTDDRYAASLLLTMDSIS